MLTGFRAFPGVPDNPTQALVAHFAGSPDRLLSGTQLALLDVDYRSVAPAIDTLLAAAPAALILTGYSRHATAITLEAQASGLCAADQPDVSGHIPELGHAPVLRTTIDLDRLQRQVSDIAPCAISQDAGQYLCNFAYRHALSRVADAGCATRVVFVHVPALAGTPLAATAAAALSLEVMAAALARIVAELSDYSPPE